MDTNYNWDQPAAFNELSLTVKDALKRAKVRIQLALFVDVFQIFVTATTLSESYDQIAALEIQLFESTHRPTVWAVVDQLKVGKIKLKRQVPTQKNRKRLVEVCRWPLSGMSRLLSRSRARTWSIVHAASV